MKKKEENKKYKDDYELSQELLRQASLEIINLRRDNSLMKARLEMFDSMMRVFDTLP